MEERRDCTKTVKLDMLVLSDGVTAYDIFGLEKDKLVKFVCAPHQHYDYHHHHHHNHRVAMFT